VFTICWSIKGGSGTTVVAAGLAVLLRRSQQQVVALDLAGDLPAALGVAEPPGPGVRDWLAAAPDVGVDALLSLGSVSDGVQVVPTGSGNASAEPSRWASLAEGLAGVAPGGVPVVVDCGGPPRPELSEATSRSIVVVRSCYLALRRAVEVGEHLATAAVLVREPGRSISGREVERVLGVPVVAEVPYDPAIARAVDAGLLLARLPASLARPLGSVLEQVA
jgi:MinD-like ATPase involved in chromosome partitioning or flagellar assembly